MTKLIVIEGTDCSGKETQTNLLFERLKKEKIKIEKLSFPMLDTPTGKIVGGSYLGKEHISKGFFEEGAANVDPKVAALYYAADRKYNLPKIISLLDKGYNVILDRFVVSNMAHQGGKIKKSEQRYEMYNWLDSLEYGFLGLPRADVTILLYVPYQYAVELKRNRKELPDQHESDEEHLKQAEAAYLELSDLYGFKMVNCIKDDKIRSIDDIHEEVYSIVKDIIQ